jgi:DNA-binding MarR family transcriptional regulator
VQRPPRTHKSVSARYGHETPASARHACQNTTIDGVSAEIDRSRVVVYDAAMPSARTRSQEPCDRSDIDDATDAVLIASRALMGVVVRSLAIVEDDVTLVQYRALVVLASRGKQGGSELADALGVQPSTATRLCDRLVAKGFMRRETSRQSGREITLTVTPAGRTLVRAVTARRRREVNRIVERLPADDRIRLRAALDTFAAAAGEMALPDDAWKLGWAP